jgi:hypothetical protein
MSPTPTEPAPTAPEMPAAEPALPEAAEPAVVDPGASADAPPVETPETAPPSPTRYRVIGPGTVCVRGRLHGRGAVLDLTPTEASSVAHLIEPCP